MTGKGTNGGEWVTVQDAAQAAGVSVWTVRRWAHAGKIASKRHKANKRLFVRREEVTAYNTLEDASETGA